jgi:ATP-dependent RNA helicase HelY
VLDDDPDLAPGDFVRWVKQVIDLLDQVAAAADGDVAANARTAAESMRRGVVAYSSVG